MVPSNNTTALLPIIAASVVAFTAVVSVLVYLTSPSTSPFNFGPKLALPVSSNEPLLPDEQSSNEKDPFDLQDPMLFTDGTPINGPQFWARVYKRKLALLVALIPPAGWNVYLLVDAALKIKTPGSIILPSLVAFSHLVCLVITYRSLHFNEVGPHWSSVIHLASLLTVDFLVAALISLLPTESQTIGINTVQNINTYLHLLPAILHLPPFILSMTTPRGPALHLPLEKFLTAKAIASAREVDAPALEPGSANVCEEAQCNVIEWLIFSSATPVIWKAYKSDSTELWELPVYLAAERAMKQFARIRKAYGKTQKTRGRSKSLFKRDGYNILIKLAKVNKTLLIAQTSLAASTAVIYYAPAFFLNRVIGYLETDPNRTDMSWGWVWCFGLFASNLIVYLAVGVLWSISTVSLQARIKLQLNTLLYSKTLVKKDVGGAGVASQDKTLEVGQVKEDDEKDGKSKSTENEDEDVNSKSQIMTLFTVDVDRVTEFVFHLFVLVDAPIEMVVATCFLFKLLGVSALFGLLATIIFMPMQHFASTFVVDTQENLMKTRDERTALMNEILGGIRMLKFMAWERSFEKRVAAVRRKELGWLRRNYAIEVAFSCVWAVSPIIVTVVAFLHFTLVRGEKLTPSIAFTSVGVFNELRFALNALPETFINMLQGFVSCRRIEKYMRAAEVSAVDNPPEGVNISLNSATITWPRDRAPDGLEGQGSGQATAAPSVAATPKAEFTLSDLNLSFPNGQLSLICGRLGSGKTLLLLGLLGEADLLAGQIICPRSTPNAMDDLDQKVAAEDWVLKNMCAYVPQQAWLQNATIKDNIIFSSPWDEKRYERVLDACSLRSDLNILEDGDQTEIGEKGLNLSGGQKARVSLARAVYSRAGTLFLDDVISAVDALTAHALVENCLQGDLIRGRTVIMVSHHTALVAPAASYVVALDKGDVKFAGTSKDFEAEGLSRTFDEAKDGPDSKKADALQRPLDSPEQPLIDLSNQASSSSSMVDTASSPETVVASVKKAPRKLVEDEKKERGRVAKEVWFMYFKALGGPLYWIIFLCSMLIAMAVPVAENGWLRFWSGSFASEDYRHTPEFYVGWFAVISIVGNLLVQLKFVVIYAGSLRASARLHDRLLESVLFATLRFHDTTNRGRLLNRFGKDVEGLDSSTADNFVRSLTDATTLLVTFASITYVGGWPFLLASFFFLGLAYQAAKVYGPASRDMRRLDSITKSPLYSAFGDAVAGGSVIRAFGASTLSLRDMMRTADTNVLAYYWTWTVNRWCSARCAVLSSGLIGCTAVSVLVAPGVTAAAAGFALAFAESISMGIISGIRQFVRLEQSMVALERVKEYSNVPQEAPEVVEPRPRASWPESGDIQVEELVIKYAPDLPNVLHSISFDVQPKMHVGVVGSTGSGKSTLALSFFRFVEATEGRIVIDGIDISKIGLSDLRSRVTIIPQDPTILSGTLRSTLDVFDEYEDVDIYDALRRTHLLGETEDTADSDGTADEEGRNKNVFRDLSSMVNEGGDNFSQGEKQLMCMARAILKRNKLLIMDEATASVDYETDELISKTIREEFRDSTILTIAHRIHTVIDFDKILVMDQGRIAEYASPADLLRDETSKFFALCKATGAEFKVLKTMAFAAEERRKAGEH